MTALCEDDTPCEPVLNAFKQGDVPVGFWGVISLKGKSAVRLGTDNCDSSELFLIKRQNAVVFQQNDTFLRSLKRDSLVLLAGNYAVRQVKMLLAVEHTEPYACAHSVNARLSDRLFIDKSLVVGFKQVLVYAAAVDIAACLYRHCCRFHGR